MNPIVRRVIILGTPLVLGILDIFHPTFSSDGTFAGVSRHLEWWIILHVLQLPLFCLLALSVYLLLDGVQGKLATLSKVALGIFVIFYPALDAILGIGTGALVSYANGTVGFLQAAMVPAVEDYFSNRVTTLVGTLGGFGWAIALLLAAVAISRPTQSRWLVIVTATLIGLAFSYYQVIRNLNLISPPISIDNLSRLVLFLAIALGLLVRPRLAAGLLVMAAYLFASDHAPPTGPVAMACYFIAALQLEIFPEKTPLVKQTAAATEEDGTPPEQATTIEADGTSPEQDPTATEEDGTPPEQTAITAEEVVPDPS